MAKRHVMIPVVIIIALSGGIIFFGSTRPVRWMRNAGIVLLRPVMSMATGTGRRLAFLTSGIGAEEARRLMEENQRLIAENFDRANLAREVDSLEAALAFREATQQKLIGARVLAYTDELGREYLLIDQGTNAGIKKGDMVVDAHRVLVGEVDDAGDDSSEVSIVSNAGMTFPALLLPGGGNVLVRGMGARILSIELVPRTASIRRGDFVARFTPGAGGRERSIAAGAIIGEVSGAVGGFVAARASLLARPETLDYVFIISSGP